ncbi:MAG: cofactor-independent phosphoglycerate mutase [Oscillospiraceae bacterium]|nr:cofactor-independent phosphoglycerate mutase [Oscillospiraceae bacterium]
MKYVIVLYDGMADLPCGALGGKTPMQLARKPLFDAMGRDAEVGLVRTVPEGMPPGSDVANLSVLGYEPRRFYTGRSPLEAVNMGVPLGADDLSLRCNLVTLAGGPELEHRSMRNYSAGDIHSDEAAELIAAVEKQLGTTEFSFYPGKAYRHCLLWRGGRERQPALGKLTPPHDIAGQPVAAHLPKGEAARPLLEMMRESIGILENHPVNAKRRGAQKPPANAIWLWGEGTRPALPAFEERFGLKGSVISAVDLLKGIARLAGLRAPEVSGATGYIDTNFEGKAHRAVEELQGGQDFAYIHIEAPDECGHRGEPQNKIRAIELIDERVLPILLDYLNSLKDFALLILPDHPTPLVTMTHSADPVPYMLYRKRWAGSGRGVASVTEESAAGTGIFIENGPELLRKMVEG